MALHGIPPFTVIAVLRCNHLSSKLVWELDCAGIANFTRSIMASPCALRCLHVVMSSLAVPDDGDTSDTRKRGKTGKLKACKYKAQEAICIQNPLARQGTDETQEQHTQTQG